MFAFGMFILGGNVGFLIAALIMGANKNKEIEEKEMERWIYKNS